MKHAEKMNELNPDYSTTRLVTHKVPIIEEPPDAAFKTVLFLPEGEGRQGEGGGLRTQGYFKRSLPEKPLITVITVVFNGAQYLEETILSVIGQTYDNVEYIIIDGGSTDGTLDIIRQYEHAVDYWISEKDGGMYDALSKAFSLATGKLIQYINAGDFLYQNSLNAIRKIFTQHSEIKWITGYRTLCNQESIIIRIELPVRYKNKLIRQGVYGRFLPYIQQESTVWKKELLQKIDIADFKKLKLAGDYYLWNNFSYHTKLHVIKTPIGIFKKHPEQLSDDISKYFREVQLFSEKRNILTYIHVLLELMVWCLNTRIIEKIISYKKISCED